jgi:class 3 adenylate cyclase/predicted ATPase
MTFDEVLSQVQDLLQREQRVSYRGLKRRFALDDEYLEDLKEELIGAKRLATDEDGRFLVWTGAQETTAAPSRLLSPQSPAPSTQLRPLEAERRQLTVMFCDLVGSTTLSTQLDPEDLREVVQAYQGACTEVIQRYEGHIAQHMGDGLLVYFGYPAAHEDDAQRAVRTSLEIIEALHHLNPHLLHPLQVRIGIHRGLVVVGEIGSSTKREVLALGETPNLAARLQGLAEPDTVVISAATYHLVHGLFTCQALALQEVKGFSTPLTVYRVLGASDAQSRFEVAVSTGLTPLVGREHEMGLLLECWEQAKEGEGQAVLLSGEPGIGKSRLAQELKEQVVHEGATRIEFRCSPYYQNTALYPIIEHLQRLLQFKREDTPHTKLDKLVHALSSYRFLQADTVPLLAALLSLPHPEGSPPLSLSPQRQKQKTHEALVAWIIEEAERQAVYCTWEDLHWADPTTLEILQLYLEQLPAARMLAVLTFRPEFQPPWSNRSYLSQITLSRLGRNHVETMAENVTGGKPLPAEVVQQIVAKTDGVPLFVEELTKIVMESGLVREAGGRYELTGPLPPLAIPATLHDSLMARLDRLATVREVAQLGSTLGREFPYELIQAVSPVDEASLQQALGKLVEAEVLYQRGLPPQTRYVFKHALIQDAAYQSLLKSRRQQYHQQIAQVLEERFSETKENQPELLAHHYTEAGLVGQAISYWQKAGQRAIQRSANIEAIGHLTKGLELLKALPDTPERTQQELMLQSALGAPLTATKGYAAPEVENAYARALELCRQLGETPRLFSVLGGLMGFYVGRGELRTAHELGEQLLRLAQYVRNPTLFLWAHYLVGENLFYMGEVALAREHLAQGITFYDPQKHSPYGGTHNPGVACLSHEALALWHLGYPDQALQKIHQALTLARELSHPLSLARALDLASWIHHFRREGQAAQEQAEATVTFCTEQGFPFYLAHGTILWGWALAEQGQEEEGIAQMQQGLAAYQATASELFRPYHLGLLAAAYGRMARIEEGLPMLAQALAFVDKTGERFSEAELYRLKGELTLQTKVQGPKSKVEEEAKECFHKAIEIAQRQSAKSWELRAVMSLARVWQKQDRKDEARQLLAEIYGWFTEGFDTKDLQEAKALLDELS